MEHEKKIEYWRSSAEEDMAAADVLLDKGKTRHALFFAELAVEKIIKAHVAKATCEAPPKTHDLLRLADLARLPLSADHRRFLARFQAYCLEGRYPDYRPPVPSGEVAGQELERAREFIRWLSSLLE